MTAPVTDVGVVIPKEWLNGALAVEIERKGQLIIISPAKSDDPILALGCRPIALEETDASAKHDRYLTGR